MARADIMAGRAFVSLYTKTDGLTRGLMKARADLNQFGSDMMSIGSKAAGMGAAMLAPLAGAVRLASDFEESFSKFSVVFGEATSSVKQWSDEFAASVGRSKLQIVQFMASTQDLFIPIGFDAASAESMSKQLTGLAVDLASFNNMSDADTLRDLHAALTGSGEVMKKYGVLVSEASVKQELLNQGMDPKAATEMQKVQARLNIIMRGTTAAHGDAIQTAGSFANQMKALESGLTDAAVEIGTALLPSLSKLASSMSAVVKKLVDAAKANPELVVSFAAVAAASGAAGAAIIAVGISSHVAAAGVGVLVSAYGAAKSAVMAVVAVTKIWAAVSVAAGVATHALSVAIGASNAIAVLSTGVSAAMAAAWSSASAIVSAAWAVMIAPATPFIAIAGVVVAALGSIAAAAAYMTIRATDFSAAWTVATGTLSELLDVAKQVGGVLMEALGGGDYDIAMAVAFAGIKLALAEAIDGMSQLWAMFWEGAWKMTKEFFSRFVSLSAKVVSALAKAIVNPTQAAASAITAALGEMTREKLSFGIDTAGMKTEAIKEIEKLERQLDERMAKRSAERKAKAEAEAKAAESAPAGPAGPGGDGTPFGAGQVQDEVTAEASAAAEKAFERETEALQQQIIALRQGAEAAERFRLAKAGLTDAEIEQVMAGQREVDALQKQEEEMKRVVDRIRDFADADYEKNKLTPAEIAAKEKQGIENARKRGAISDKVAAEANAEADLRQSEREHQERLKAFKGEGGYGRTSSSSSGQASAATFSAASLVAMGGTTGQSQAVKAAMDTKKAIENAAKQAKEASDAQIAAIEKQGLHHA